MENSNKNVPENENKGINRGINRKESESHRRAALNYRKKNTKKIVIEAKIQHIDKIKEYCKHIDISQNQFILRCINYFIDRDEIPPE